MAPWHLSLAPGRTEVPFIAMAKMEAEVKMRWKSKGFLLGLLPWRRVWYIRSSVSSQLAV